MSGLYDYKIAERLVADDVPFDALIMAAMLRGDAVNRAPLVTAYPTLAAETAERYHAPGAALDGD